MKRIIFIFSLLFSTSVFAVCNPFNAGMVLTATALNSAIASPCVNAGTIDGSPIGLVTPAAVKGTTGTFNIVQAGSGATGLIIQPLVSATQVGIYGAGITPSNTNYALTIGAAGNSAINGPTISSLNVGGSIIASATASGVAVTGTLSSTGQTTASGGLATSVSPEVAAATYTQLTTDTDLLVNFAGTVTLTLLNPATYPGRYLTIRTYQAQLVNSASANVSVNGVVGSSILAATAGKWARLKSDGVNWEIITNN